MITGNSFTITGTTTYRVRLYNPKNDKVLAEVNIADYATALRALHDHRTGNGIVLTGISPTSQKHVSYSFTAEAIAFLAMTIEQVTLPWTNGTFTQTGGTGTGTGIIYGNTSTNVPHHPV